MVYRLKDKQRFLAQDVLNTYYFDLINGEGKAQELAEAFTAVWIPQIVTPQNVALTHTEVEVVNLDDPTDFYILTHSSPIPGADSGDVMPPFVAWGFKKARGSVLQRNGSMRLAGVTESLVSDGVATAGALAELNALATVFSGGLSDGSGNTWEQGYLIDTDNPQGGTFVGGTLWSYTRVTSQNSRKFGRGS